MPENWPSPSPATTSSTSSYTPINWVSSCLSTVTSISAGTTSAPSISGSSTSTSVPRNEEEARRVLWDACDQGRLFCTQILDMLLQLATGTYRKTGSHKKNDEETVYPGSLTEVLFDYTDIQISKDDPYRLRFGELVGRSRQDWETVERRFFEYAIRDAIATRRLYPAPCIPGLRTDDRTRIQPRRNSVQYPTGRCGEVRLSRRSNSGSGQRRAERHVPTRRAYRFDRRTYAGGAKLRAELDQAVATLERDYRDVLTYKATNQLVLTKMGRTPSLAEEKLNTQLTTVVAEIRLQGHAIEPPMSPGKKLDVFSRSLKKWVRYAKLHPFLSLWSQISKLGKLLAFFTKLNTERQHCAYTLLKRTGRTSCAESKSSIIPSFNLQQTPKRVTSAQ